MQTSSTFIPRGRAKAKSDFHKQSLPQYAIIVAVPTSSRLQLVFLNTLYRSQFIEITHVTSYLSGD